MRGYCRNNISYGTNRKKMKDQSVIKRKLKVKMDKDQIGLSFLGGFTFWRRREEKRGGRKKERKKKKKKKKEKRIKGMDFYTLVWML